MPSPRETRSVHVYYCNEDSKNLLKKKLSEFRLSWTPVSDLLPRQKSYQNPNREQTNDQSDQVILLLTPGDFDSELYFNQDEDLIYKEIYDLHEEKLIVVIHPNGREARRRWKNVEDRVQFLSQKQPIFKKLYELERLFEISDDRLLATIHGNEVPEDHPPIPPRIHNKVNRQCGVCGFV